MKTNKCISQVEKSHFELDWWKAMNTLSKILKSLFLKQKDKIR
jgi:hypothetical protein